MRFPVMILAAATWLAASLSGCQQTSTLTKTAADASATVDARLLNDPTRRVLKLTNGFTIILQQNKTAPVVAARVYVKAGSITEQQHMGAGISHVLEHLVAGASSGKRKEAENVLLLLQIGNDSNAYTQEDHTCYFITTTSEPQKWRTAVDLLVDFTTNSDFTRAEFNREFEVVQREIEMGQAEAERTFYRHAQANRYLENPAGHPVIGYKAAFQKLTYEDCKAYFKEMYVPDNMIISLAGDIDLDEAEKLLTEQLKSVPRKTQPAIALPAEPHVMVPRRSVANADVRQARVLWAFPTMSLYNPELYATDVLASVLGGSESSILVRRLRDELGLVVAVGAANPTPRYAEGQLEVTAVLSPDKILPAQQAFLSALNDITKNGVPAEAVERAKTQAMADSVYGNQTAEQQAIRNALDYLATGNIDFTEQYVKHIQAVTPADVLNVAKKYLTPDRMLTTALLPLNVKDPFAATAADQRALAPIAIKKTVLKNGVTVLVSRNPVAPLASVHLYTLGGLLAETDSTNGTGTAMMELLTRGTESRTHEQIAEFLDATGTTLGSESGNNSFSLSMQCLKEKTDPAFALFADLALHPRFAREELDQIRPPLLAAVEQSTEDWFDEAYKLLRESYYASSPYKRLPVGKEEVIAKLTPELIRAHYQNYFLNPKQMVIAISGDIDEAAAEKWAAQFESIPVRYPAFNSASTPAAPTTIRKHTEKQSATVMYGFPPGMPITSPDRHALILLQTYLGGYSSPGGSVLHETLRGKGLVYTVQASLATGPANGMFLIYALGEPKNVEPIQTDIAAIIEKTKRGDIPDNLLAAAKDQAVTGKMLSKQTIADRTSSQALDEVLGLGYDDDARFAEKIRAVTKADLIRVANKYLGNPTIVIMTPEAPK